MNWFKLYIGDYQRDTAHLTVTEHGAYLLMLQHYYATEKPLPVGKSLHRMLRAQDKQEREAIDAVSSQFWTVTDAGLVNHRADRELAKAGEQADTNRAIAVAREARRKVARTVHESCADRGTNDQPNQTPDTRHQTNTEDPHTPAKRGRSSVHEFPPGFEAFWSAYPRKAAKPKAAQAFARIRPDDALLAAMLAAIAVQALSEQWVKDGGQFIPMPASWLNARRWEDQMPAASRFADPFAGAA